MVVASNIVYYGHHHYLISCSPHCNIRRHGWHKPWLYKVPSRKVYCLQLVRADYFFSLPNITAFDDNLLQWSSFISTVQKWEASRNKWYNYLFSSSHDFKACNYINKVKNKFVSLVSIQYMSTWVSLGCCHVTVQSYVYSNETWSVDGNTCIKWHCYTLSFIPHYTLKFLFVYILTW